MIDYFTFRANALASLALVGNKRTYKTKTDIDYWIETEYNRHVTAQQMLCIHDWESFKGNGYETDLHVCRNCGERRAA
jgi:hypothetical protein